MWQFLKLSDVSLGILLRYSPVVDKDVKKPNKPKKIVPDFSFGKSQLSHFFPLYSSGENEVWNLAPFTSKDFQIRGIADRIKDLHSLVYLYPGKAKDSVFSKYYTSTTGKVFLFFSPHYYNLNYSAVFVDFSLR